MSADDLSWCALAGARRNNHYHRSTMIRANKNMNAERIIRLLTANGVDYDGVGSVI